MADFGITTVLAILGTAVSAAGTIAAGNQQEAAAEFEAAQLEAAGKEETAASQREAQRIERERDRLLSRGQAVSAASGLGALDETVLDLSGDIVEEGGFQRDMTRYGGDQRASGRQAQATASRMSGKAAKTGSMFAAAGTIMGGMGSFAKDWGARNTALASSAPSLRYG